MFNRLASQLLAREISKAYLILKLTKQADINTLKKANLQYSYISGEETNVFWTI